MCSRHDDDTYVEAVTKKAPSKITQETPTSELPISPKLKIYSRIG